MFYFTIIRRTIWLCQHFEAKLSKDITVPLQLHSKLYRYLILLLVVVMWWPVVVKWRTSNLDSWCHCVWWFSMVWNHCRQGKFSHTLYDVCPIIWIHNVHNSHSRNKIMSVVVKRRCRQGRRPGKGYHKIILKTIW